MLIIQIKICIRKDWNNSQRELQLAKDWEMMQTVSSAVSNQSCGMCHSMMAKPFSFTEQTQRVTQAPSSPSLGVQGHIQLEDICQRTRESSARV